MKKLLTATAIVIALGTATPVLAQHGGGDHPSREEFKKMSPEERQAFFEKKKADFDKLPKEEKIKLIEKRRAERIRKMDEHWGKMTDDEKITFVEKRMERHGKRGFGKHKTAE